MGSLFSSSTTTTRQPYEQNPWEPQQEFLIDGFNNARTALDNAMAGNDRITDPVADLNANQMAALDRIRQMGLGQAGQVSRAALEQGMAGIDGISTAAGNAGDIYARASMDPTAGIISNAERYMQDPNLQGQIDAALGDVREAFDRNVAGINSGASASGNINSTRAGVLESRALDDAMDRGAAISSQMRGDAYQAGLDRATMTQAQGIRDMLSANGMLSSTGQSALDAAQVGLSVGSAGATDALNAGNMTQGQAQAEIDGMRQLSSANLDLVNRYMQAIGGNYGGNGYTTQVSQNQSPFQTILGGASTIAGLW